MSTSKGQCWLPNWPRRAHTPAAPKGNDGYGATPGEGRRSGSGGCPGRRSSHLLPRVRAPRNSSGRRGATTRGPRGPSGEERGEATRSERTGRGGRSEAARAPRPSVPCGKACTHTTPGSRTYRRHEDRGTPTHEPAAYRPETLKHRLEDPRRTGRSAVRGAWGRAPPRRQPPPAWPPGTTRGYANQSEAHTHAHRKQARRIAKPPGRPAPAHATES